MGRIELIAPPLTAGDRARVEADFRRRLRRATILPVLGLLSAAAVLVALVLHLQRLTRWADHTDVVIGRAHLVERLAIDAQSRFRAYLLTGEPKVLESYRGSSGEVAEAIGQLRDLVRDNPPQGERLLHIEAEVVRWQAYSQREVSRKQAGAPLSAVAARLNEGADLMGAVRKELYGFLDVEERLRAQRLDEADAVTRQALLAAAALALLLGPLIALATAREMRRVRRSYHEALEAAERAASSLRESRQQMRELAQRQELLVEQEQRRISRELHDEMGQLLTALRLDVEAIEEGLSATEDAPLPALLDRAVDASELAAQMVGALQRVLAALRPPSLDRLGLGPALREEGRRFQERTGVDCDVVLPDGREGFGPEIDTALFRIAQEALTNVARHAHAEHVTVALDAGDGSISLCVEDDGDGIDLGSTASRSLGIVGMRERIERLGGELTVAPGARRGTAVRARIPADRALAAPPRTVA